LRHNKKGFTVIELLIGLIIGAILVLIIGAISGIGNASFDRAVKESSVYNDAFTSLNLMKFLGRKSHTIITYNTSQFGLASGAVLQLDNSAFGLSTNQKDFIYLKDKSNTTDKKELIKDATNITLTLDPANSAPTNVNNVTVTLHVEKQKESFDLSTSIMRRN
jgi:prepilin-type N-terminal cleavage/methylation domain-containing protein